jgi:hypothetical protein
MADTGFLIVGTATDVSSTWANESNITADNNLYATDSIPDLGQSGVLRGTNISAGISAGSTVDGVEVQIHAKSTSAFAQTFQGVRLVYGGSPIGTAPTVGQSPSGDISSSETTYTFGGPTDLWGTTLDVGSGNDVNASTFGAQFTVQNDGEDPETTSIDVVKIKVYYTEAAGGGTLIWPIT